MDMTVKELFFRTSAECSKTWNKLSHLSTFGKVIWRKFKVNTLCFWSIQSNRSKFCSVPLPQISISRRHCFFPFVKTINYDNAVWIFASGWLSKLTFNQDWRWGNHISFMAKDNCHLATNSLWNLGHFDLVNCIFMAKISSTLGLVFFFFRGVWHWCVVLLHFPSLVGIFQCHYVASRHMLSPHPSNHLWKKLQRQHREVQWTGTTYWWGESSLHTE